MRTECTQETASVSARCFIMEYMENIQLNWRFFQEVRQRRCRFI